MNYSNELNTVNAKIETLNAQLAQLLKEQTILTQLVEMKEKMNLLEASLTTEEKAPFSVTDLTEENYQYYNCTFACKVNDEEDFNRSLECGGGNGQELTVVQRIIELDSDLFAAFKADTMNYFDWLKGFGGSTCSIDLEAKYPEHKEEMEGMKFLQLMNTNPEIKADWYKGLMQIGTLIVDRNDKKDFVIANQQGYDYCRYISFPSHITEAPTPKTAA